MQRSVLVVTMLLLFAIAFVTGCAKEEEQIELGASLPLTGEVASYGERARRGIEIGVEEINAAGGVRGKKLGVAFEDDRNDPKTAVSIMTKFAKVDRVAAVLGSAGSTVSLAMTPVANQNKVVLLSPISSSVRLTTEGGPYFFRVCPADDAQAKILAEWVWEKGHRKVALVYTNNSWGKPLAEAFEDYYRRLGGKVVVSEAVEERATDMRSQLAKIKAVAIGAIVSPTYPVEGGNLLRQGKELGIRAEYYGGDNWDAPEFLTAAGDAANGAFFVDPSEPRGDRFSEFSKKHRARYGKQPDINAAFGYDALFALVQAMSQTKLLDGPSIRHALHSVSFKGATGMIEFDENGDLKTPAFDRNVIRNGEKVKISQQSNRKGEN